MKKKTVVCAIGAVSVATVGFIVIPPMIEKYGRKLYKSSLDTNTINFDELGPEIIKKDELKAEV